MHSHILKLIPAVCLLPAMVACSGASVTESVQPEVELTVQGAMETGQLGAPRISSATAEVAVLEGVISSPNPCYSFDAVIEADDGALTVTITGSQQPGMCIQVLGAFRYQARITGLSTGTYPVRMIYMYPDTGWETREFDLTLTIP